MRRVSLVVLACALLGMTLAACDDDTDSGTAPPSTAAPTSTSPTSDDPPDDVAPPVMPAAAREKTTAGAKAFVKYYIDVLNYGFTHNSSEGVRELATRECDVCERFADSIDKNLRRGGGQTGGQWTPTKIWMLTNTAQQPTVTLAEMRVATGYYVESQGGVRHPIRSKTLKYEFWIAWHQGSWAAADVRTAS